ncbi:MAG TPA: hypothetical protein VG167_20405 [Verrucomicrobiae bacterium]|nr:hypothetical protein [Verrucomicrobiae bacterium]
MSPGTPNPVSTPQRSYRGFYVTGAVLLGLACAVIGITGYFRLGSDTQALRDSCLSAAPGQWHKKFSLRVGLCTTALARTVASGFKLEPDAQAALEAVHGAEVGIYDLAAPAAEPTPAALLARADRVMLRRGWDRIVGVVNERELVAIYLPHRGVSLRHMNCALMVFHENQLIVVGARANLKPLADVAARHLEVVERGAGERRAGI